MQIYRYTEKLEHGKQCTISHLRCLERSSDVTFPACLTPRHCFMDEPVTYWRLIISDLYLGTHEELQRSTLCVSYRLITTRTPSTQANLTFPPYPHGYTSSTHPSVLTLQYQGSPWLHLHWFDYSNRVCPPQPSNTYT